MRKARRLTQRALSEKTGISQCYISALEQGSKRSPSMDVIRRIAGGLGVAPARVLEALEEAV